MKHTFRLLAFACLVGTMMLTSCEKLFGGDEDDDNIIDGDDATALSGLISENRTLPDLGLDVDYIVNGTLTIDGNALLTVEPGVTIMFTGENDGVVVNENAGLKMVGTADKPIRFVGPANNPNNGSWHAIKYLSKRNDNQMEYVQLLRGGSGEASWDGVLQNYGKLSMKHCTIDGSASNGIDMDDGVFTAFEGNTIKNCAWYPIYNESGIKWLKNFGANTYTANGKNYIRVGGGDELTENLTVINAGIPYYFEGDCGVTGSYTFTIEAGTTFLFNMDTRFYTNDEPEIRVNGTEANPIIFRGMRNEAGYWHGFWPESTRQSNMMSFCKIYDAGREEGWRGGCLYLGSSTRMYLTSCEFGNSGHYGVVIEDVEAFRSRINHELCTFVDCPGGNVYFEETGETADLLPM